MLDVVGCSLMHRKIPTALNSMTNWSQSSSSAATSFSYLSLGRCSAEGFCGLSRADTYFMNSRTLLNFANSLMCMAHWWKYSVKNAKHIFQKKEELIPFLKERAAIMYAQNNDPLMTNGRFINCVHRNQPLHICRKLDFLQRQICYCLTDRTTLFGHNASSRGESSHHMPTRMNKLLPCWAKLYITLVNNLAEHDKSRQWQQMKICTFAQPTASRNEFSGYQLV